jgi:hypothetical protein
MSWDIIQYLRISHSILGYNISGEESSHNDENSHDDESDSETSQTSDDIYSKHNFVKYFEEINVF